MKKELNGERSTSELLEDAFYEGSVRSLHDLYVDCATEFLRLRKERGRGWDPDSPSLLVNRVSGILQQIDPDTLKESDQHYRNSILNRLFEK